MERRTRTFLLVSLMTLTAIVPAGTRAATSRTEADASANHAAPSNPRAEDPYAPFAFLIGEWDTPGGIRQSIRWGPQKSYLWYAVYVRPPGASGEELHQEGLMTFNGKDRDLDFLFVHDPGSLNQEQGKVHAEADGSIVRETTAIYADGSVSHFRQTWRSTGENTALTSLLREDADGRWVPNFPGAEKLEMTRRPG